MEFIESKSGKQMLVLDDEFKYYFTANRWRCYKKDCSASVYFNEKNDEIVKRKGNFFKICEFHTLYMISLSYYQLIIINNL